MRSPPHTPTWTHHKSSLKPSPSKPTPDRPCYRCQQPGHWARECPVGRQPQRKVRLVTADNGDSSGPASDVEPPLGFADGPPHSDCVYTDPDDDDVYNASHVALDCDGTPTSDVTVRSASAPREWFLPVTVGGVDTLMLVDTGAMRTCLASTVISPHIPPLELDTTKNIRLHSAGGDPLTVHGQWDCSLTVGDSDFPVRALVCDLGGPHGLLGADFLTSYGARLNWLEGTLYLKGKPFRLTGRRPPKTRGPGQVVLSVVGVSHGLDHEFTVRGDSAVLPPGSLTNVTLMQEPEPTSHLAVVKADGNITLSRPLADVQGTTPMPCSLVADLSAPVPREARQPDDPTDPTPDLVGEQLTLEVESGLASLRAPDSAPGPMKGPPPALTVSDEVAPGTGPKVEVPPPPGFPPSQPLAVLQPLNAPPTTDDDDVRNASHVASDRDSTPPIGVPVWSTSAPRGWTAELQDYKKRKKGKIVMDVVIMPWPLPVSRDVFDHCCPPPLSRQSDPPPTHPPPHPSHSYSFHVPTW